MPAPRVMRVTIANGASQSEEIDLQGADALAIIIPAAWTAAAITFLVSADPGGTYGPLYDDAGTEATVASAAVVALRVISLRALVDVLKPIRYLKLRSGVAATPVNQGADRIIPVLINPLP
jgi:hypothetical protein